MTCQVLNGFGHVPTNDEGLANDIVDAFITDVLATNPPRSDPTGNSPARSEQLDGAGGAVESVGGSAEAVSAK